MLLYINFKIKKQPIGSNFLKLIKLCPITDNANRNELIVVKFQRTNNDKINSLSMFLKCTSLEFVINAYD